LQQMKGKTVTIVLLVFSVILNLFFIYTFIGQSITIDYMGQHAKSQDVQIHLLKDMLKENTHFNDKESALSELQKKYPDKIVNQEGDTIYVDEIGFKFEDGKFKSIVTMN